MKKRSVKYFEYRNFPKKYRKYINNMAQRFPADRIIITTTPFALSGSEITVEAPDNYHPDPVIMERLKPTVENVYKNFQK